MLGFFAYAALFLAGMGACLFGLKMAFRAITWVLNNAGSGREIPFQTFVVDGWIGPTVATIGILLMANAIGRTPQLVPMEVAFTIIVFGYFGIRSYHEGGVSRFSFARQHTGR